MTTQYLEEADELADRVGIINAGLLVGEGTPDQLKRSVGADVVTLRVDNTDAAIGVLEALPEVDKVERGPRALLASVSNGAAAVSPIAVALDAANVSVVELTLRNTDARRCLLELTGDRIEVAS